MGEIKKINGEIETGKNLKEIVIKVADFLKERKATDILVMDMRGIVGYTDFFIICTTTSTVHTKSIVRDLDELNSEIEIKPFTMNVDTNSPWVLIDYNFFILHLFLEEGRRYYQLEKLWSDAEIIYQYKG